MFRFCMRCSMVAIACLMLLGMYGQIVRGQAEEKPTEKEPFSILKDEVLKITDKAVEKGDISVFIGTIDGEIKINESEVYSAASTIKVPILVEGIRQAEKGNLNLDEKMRFDPSDIVGGSGVLNLLSDNQTLTIRDLMTLMIVVSDNSATNMLIDRLGMDAVNETCRKMGCQHTLLQRYMMDLDTPKDNLTSAEDMVKILKAIDTGNIVSQEGRDEIIRIMREQKLTSYLPAYDDHRGIKFASKGGGLAGPKIRHDVALITLGDRTVYAAVLTKGLSMRTAQRSLAEIGESIMDYLVAPPPPSEPAQYETDFTRYEPGGSPSDWSSLWKDSNWTILDDPRRLKHVMPPASGIVRRALTWNEVGKISGDVALSAVVRAQNTRKSKFQLGFHMSELSSNKTFYYLDIFGSDNGSGPARVRLNRFLNGRWTLFGSEELPFAFEENTWYQVVIKRTNDTIKAKVWPYGEDEPDEWLVTAKDQSIDYGLVGLIHLTPEVVNEWAFFSVGTGGEPAPRAPDDLFKVLSAADIIESVKQFEEKGAFANHGVARSLKVHLNTVGHFERKKVADKVIKHMEGFKRLLDKQKDGKLISKQAYNALYSDAESLISIWQ